MLLKILIIHESRVIINIIRDYILADHPDAAVDAETEAKNAVLKLKTGDYDVIFADLEIKGLLIRDIAEIMNTPGKNTDTRLIVMASEKTPAFLDLQIEYACHFLPIPCSSTAFRDVLYRVFNPKIQTEHTLYKIPEATAVIRTEDASWPVRILSIGAEWIVGEIKQDATDGKVRRWQEIIIRFPADYGKASVISFRAVIKSGRALKAQQDDKKPDMIKMAWQIEWQDLELLAATKKTLTMKLGRAADVPLAVPVSEPLPDPVSDQISDPISDPVSDPIGEPAFKTEQDLHAAKRLYQAKKDQGKEDQGKEDQGKKNAALEDENNRLIQRIARMERKITELEKGIHQPVSRISLGTLINELASPTNDPAKLSIFQKIVDENIKLRNQSKS